MFKFSEAAKQCIEETGIDPNWDLDRLKDGQVDDVELLRDCLDGADDDRIQGWMDYVQEIVRHM